MAILMPMSCVATGSHADISGPCYSGSHVNVLGLWYQHRLLVSVGHSSGEGHIDAHGLYCHWRPGGGPWHMLMLETMWMSMIHGPADDKGKDSYLYSSISDHRLTVVKEKVSVTTPPSSLLPRNYSDRKLLKSP